MAEGDIWALCLECHDRWNVDLDPSPLECSLFPWRLGVEDSFEMIAWGTAVNRDGTPYEEE